ncbi:MAG TPA: hypothetical protein VL992_09310, partial [Tepidisphaeraceae bacterium]|nr:hypothetical protein [Tepidisphaeraceae bacterium]
MKLTLVSALLGLLLLTHPCAAADRTPLVINSLDGPVTPAEIQSFKNFIAAMPLPTTSWGGPGKHNMIMDGADGQAVEAMGLVYEITGDPQILNRMIAFADRFVSLRDDLPGGSHRPMWDGIVHKTWLP